MLLFVYIYDEIVLSGSVITIGINQNAYSNMLLQVGKNIVVKENLSGQI